MTSRLIDIPFTELNPTVRTLSDAGVTEEDAAWLRKPGNAALVAAFIHDQRGVTDKNVFEQSLEDQLKLLLRADEEENWGLGNEVYNKLRETAPEWPKGRLAFRSPRIRFGEGDEGVAQTFEAHAKRIQKVFGDSRFWRWELLRSDKDHLRLLMGNNTHKPVIEWITFDLEANRERESISAVRGPKSLADELLVFTWLFPDYAPAIDYDKNPAPFAAGYELHVPGDDVESWRIVPYVYWDRDDGRVGLNACWRSYDGSDYSVPDLRE